MDELTTCAEQVRNLVAVSADETPEFRRHLAMALKATVMEFRIYLTTQELAEFMTMTYGELTTE